MEKSIYVSYISQIQRYSLLTAEQEKELAIQVHKGDNAAKLKLVHSNLRLVVSIAHKYTSYCISVMDLIQEGNLGLLVAASKFHHSFDTRFSTYAYSWITQYMIRYIQKKVPMISVPHRTQELLHRIHKAKIDLIQQTRKEPTLKEMAEYLGLSELIVSNAINYDYACSSIDTQIQGTSNLTFSDMIEDTSLSPEQVCLNNLEVDDIRSLVETLPIKERQVIYYRFNFDNNCGPKTLRQISKLLGISSENVRQIEMRALQFLRKAATKAS